MLELELERLTRAERFLIKRRRDGLSQEDAAKRQNVSLHQWRQWERGSGEAPEVELTELQTAEKCFLLRRRARKTLKTVADEVGVTEYWLGQMERGQEPCEKLAAYWESRSKPWRGSPV